jgi:hypothetical protein
MPPITVTKIATIGQTSRRRMRSRPVHARRRSRAAAGERAHRSHDHHHVAEHQGEQAGDEAAMNIAATFCSARMA